MVQHYVYVLNLLQYSCETKVINTGKGLKGLTLYGDDKNLIAWELKEINLF